MAGKIDYEMLEALKKNVNENAADKIDYLARKYGTDIFENLSCYQIVRNSIDMYKGYMEVLEPWCYTNEENPLVIGYFNLANTQDDELAVISIKRKILELYPSNKNAVLFIFRRNQKKLFFLMSTTSEEYDEASLRESMIQLTQGNVEFSIKSYRNNISRKCIDKIFEDIKEEDEEEYLFFQNQPEFEYFYLLDYVCEEKKFKELKAHCLNDWKGTTTGEFFVETYLNPFCLSSLGNFLSKLSTAFEDFQFAYYAVPIENDSLFCEVRIFIKCPDIDLTAETLYDLFIYAGCYDAFVVKSDGMKIAASELEKLTEDFSLFPKKDYVHIPRYASNYYK